MTTSPRRTISPALAAGCAALACAAGACVDEGPLPVDDTRAPIIGGVVDTGDPAIAMIVTGGGSCTATLVGRRTLLTAGHCVIDAIRAGSHSGQAHFGTGGSDGFFASVPLVQLAAHRYYETFQFYDIAMVRLGRDAPAEIEPMRFQIDPLDGLVQVGDTVRVVGFGVTDGEAQTGAGVKRTVDLRVTSIGKHHIGYGDEGHNICQGDSGGPTLRDDFPNGEVVIAVSSYGSNACRSESRVARTDTYADWLIEVYDAWEGPCKQDGVCVTDGCRTPDPDCDPCGFDGVCASDCPRPDLDCPVGGFAGDPCSDDFDCEDRLCAPAIDDPRIRFCSAPCDPSRPIEEVCPPPLTLCSDEGTPGDFTCRYGAPTPGALGADCADGSDCRSGACDGEVGICVEPCGDGAPACPDGYECRTFGDVSACTLPRDGGGCGCRAASPVDGGLWAIAVAYALARRRRRARA
ncbi:MAG: hypothetical protein D6689_00180 [Deltaproteobacteria bacterium]|nr:MAG: hypothetical protein D6689_00180 [Deltaproteobacteria bacterium]